MMLEEIGTNSDSEILYQTTDLDFTKSVSEKN